MRPRLAVVLLNVSAGAGESAVVALETADDLVTNSVGIQGLPRHGS